VEHRAESERARLDFERRAGVGDRDEGARRELRQEVLLQQRGLVPDVLAERNSGR
jgi:hypothetical protein